MMAKRKRKVNFRDLPLLRSRKVARAGIWLATILVVSFLFPLGDQFEYRYDLNEITREAVIAPFNFPVLKSEGDLKAEREAARQSVPWLFRRDTQVASQQSSTLVDFFNRIRRIQRAAQKLSQSEALAFRHQFDEQSASTRQAVARDSTALMRLQEDLAQQFPLDLSSTHWAALFQGQSDTGRKIDLDRLQRNLERIIRDLFSEGVLELAKRQIGDAPLAVSNGGVEENVELQFLMDQDVAQVRAKTRLQGSYADEQTVEHATGNELLYYSIRPNLLTTSTRSSS